MAIPGTAPKMGRMLCRSVSLILLTGLFFAILASPVRSEEPAAALPLEVKQALDSYRAEGAFGWSFEQCTRSDGEELVESYNPAQAEGLRWNLISKNGRAPSRAEAETYARGKALRSSAWNAPRLEKQIDRASFTLVSNDGQKLVGRFRLLPADAADIAAEHLQVTCTIDLASKTVEQVEIANRTPFSPAFGVRLSHSRTVLTYSLPTAERPSLLQRASMEVRGRMFWVKGIEQTMEIVWGKYAFAGAVR